MDHTAKGLRKKLLSLVKKMGKTPEVYASRPGKDFTRRRALGFENIILLLLTMGSESVGKNLMEVFHFQKKHPPLPRLCSSGKSCCLKHWKPYSTGLQASSIRKRNTAGTACSPWTARL